MTKIVSGCTKYMSRNKALFTSFSKKKGVSISYGDNGKGKIIGYDNINKNPSIEFFYMLRVYNITY